MGKRRRFLLSAVSSPKTTSSRVISCTTRSGESLMNATRDRTTRTTAGGWGDRPRFGTLPESTASTSTATGSPNAIRLTKI
ncbi:hypothetical protein L596_003531 [Steinernema carpocapsae]|uniref:Uncharacterized protein n=1 Tax=Steinernema carpocapsae TaxID=34508 RepID=A0A4U8UST2_STECR|nr:hypothetical protein L596_003531 [Steinernema carpocapsae]